MDKQYIETGLISRRNAIGATGAIATLGILSAARSDADDRSELEIVNETLVTNFCRDYSKLDVDVLSAYLADDILYQISESQGVINGLQEYRERNGDIAERFEAIDWRILRSHAIGPLVVNERIDFFIARPGTRQPNMRFAVAGYFLVQDGKIQVWRDFGMPGVRPVVSPSEDTRNALLKELGEQS